MASPNVAVTGKIVRVGLSADGSSKRVDVASRAHGSSESATVESALGGTAVIIPQVPVITLFTIVGHARVRVRRAVDNSISTSLARMSSQPASKTEARERRRGTRQRGGNNAISVNSAIGETCCDFISAQEVDALVVGPGATNVGPRRVQVWPIALLVTARVVCRFGRDVPRGGSKVAHLTIVDDSVATGGRRGGRGRRRGSRGRRSCHDPSKIGP